MAITTREAYDILQAEITNDDNKAAARSRLRDALAVANVAEESAANAEAKLTDLDAKVQATTQAIVDLNAKYDQLIEDRKADYKAKSEEYATATKQAQDDAAAQQQAIADQLKASQDGLAAFQADADTKKAALNAEITSLTAQRDSLQSELSNLKARLSVATG